MSDEPRAWEISVNDIALMRQLIAWRKTAGVVLRRERGAWVDMSKPWRGGRRMVTWDDGRTWTTSEGPSDNCQLGYAEDYSTDTVTWVDVASLTEAVDILVARRYVPARFSSAYRAGWDAADRGHLSREYPDSEPVFEPGTHPAHPEILDPRHP